MELTAKIENVIPKLFQLDRDKLYDIKIEEHKEKRSLNANSYLWVLCTKIADKLTTGYNPVTLNSKPDGYFKYYDYNGRSILNGKVADWYIVYKGSSEYNTYEMSVLLNGVVEECKNLNIETKTQQEIISLLDNWEK